MAIQVEVSSNFAYKKEEYFQNPTKTNSVATYTFFSEEGEWSAIITANYSAAVTEAKKQYSQWFKTNFGKIIAVKAKKPS